MFDFIKRNPFFCLFIFLLIVSPTFLYGVGVVLLVILALIAIGILTFWWKIRTLQKQAQASQQQWNQQAQQQWNQQAQQQWGAGGQHRGGQQQEQKTRNRNRHSGDVDIKIVDPTKGKRVADDVGDYVDFEEVKDK